MSFKSYLGLLLGFCIAYILLQPEQDDDDNDPDGGLMSPVYEGA